MSYLNDTCSYCNRPTLVPSSQFENRDFCYQCGFTICNNCNMKYMNSTVTECEKCSTFSPKLPEELIHNNILSEDLNNIVTVKKEEDFETQYDNLLSKTILANLRTKHAKKEKVSPPMWTGTDDIFLP